MNSSLYPPLELVRKITIMTQGGIGIMAILSVIAFLTWLVWWIERQTRGEDDVRTQD